MYTLTQPSILLDESSPNGFCPIIGDKIDRYPNVWLYKSDPGENDVSWVWRGGKWVSLDECVECHASEWTAQCECNNLTEEEQTDEEQ